MRSAARSRLHRTLQDESLDDLRVAGGHGYCGRSPRGDADDRRNSLDSEALTQLPDDVDEAVW